MVYFDHFEFNLLTNYSQCTDVNLRYLNTGLVPSGVSLASWGESASLVLVGQPSSDGVTIKIPYGVDV